MASERRDLECRFPARRGVGRRFSVGILALLCVAGPWSPRPSRAGCNIIPPAVRAFQGTLGAIDRPFARPGDLLTLSLGSECEPGAAFPAQADDQVVSLIFKPATGGPVRMVVLAKDCAA